MLIGLLITLLLRHSTTHPTALLQHSTAHHRTVNTPILHQLHHLHPTVRLSTPPYITVHNIYNYNDYATDSTVRYSNNKVHSSQKQYGVQYIVNPTTIHRQTHRLQPTNIPGGPRHHHCTSCHHHHHHQPVSISKKLSQEKVLAPPQPPDPNTQLSSSLSFCYSPSNPSQFLPSSLLHHHLPPPISTIINNPQFLSHTNRSRSSLLKLLSPTISCEYLNHTHPFHPPTTPLSRPLSHNRQLPTF